MSQFALNSIKQDYRIYNGTQKLKHILQLYKYVYKQMDSKFNDKSYKKVITLRKAQRQLLFERNRQMKGNSGYLEYYSPQMQNSIRISLEGDIPLELPPVQYAGIQTISYYRRSKKPVFKTRMSNQQPHDPHMTFESLWCLAAIQDVDQYPNSQKVVKQFQQNLNSYLSMPYEQIRQMAVIAAGNKILGREQDILRIVDRDQNQLWVLINHIYERKINFTIMYKYLDKKLSIVYRTIYEMTNNQKDEIIQSIIKNEQILSKFIEVLNQKDIDEEIPLFSIRIIGNILAQRDDYSEIFMRYNLLDRISELLKKVKPPYKKDIMWMLSNYISDSVPARQLLCKPYLLQKILMIYKTQNKEAVKLEIYHILYNLAYYGNKLQFYKISIQEKIIQQCSYDIETLTSQNNDLILIIFRLILKLIQIAKQYVTEMWSQTSGRNPFITYIKYSNLRKYIQGYSYNKNQEISNISLDIENQIMEEQQDFPDGEM